MKTCTQNYTKCTLYILLISICFAIMKCSLIAKFAKVCFEVLFELSQQTHKL